MNMVHRALVIWRQQFSAIVPAGRKRERVRGEAEHEAGGEAVVVVVVAGGGIGDTSKRRSWRGRGGSVACGLLPVSHHAPPSSRASTAGWRP